MNRRAVSLIELIFTIVIIGVAFLSVPTILRITNSSTAQMMESRAFYHGLAMMQTIINKPWDQANAEDFNTSGVYFELNATNDPSTLYCDANKTRPGNYIAKYRRLCDSDSGHAPSEIGITDAGENSSSNNWNDIDDFAFLNMGDEATKDNYYISGALLDSREFFKIGVDVNYTTTDNGSDELRTTFDTSDLPTNDFTSIKRITVITKSGNTEISRYYYFATNIGVSRPFVLEND